LCNFRCSEDCAGCKYQIGEIDPKIGDANTERRDTEPKIENSQLSLCRFLTY
jgi:hypothetical protein